MRLYICEKPSQGTAYATAIGYSSSGRNDGYLECNNGDIVTWCFGHLLSPLDPDDYGEEYKKWSLSTLPILPKDKWKYIVVQDKKAQYNKIKKLVSQADEVVVASDPDREGEMIVVSLLERMGYKGPRKRTWAGAQDVETLRRAIKNMKDASKTHDLYLACMTRQKADWIHGMNLTRAMTVANAGFIENVFSVGRVQTATLAFVVMRDKEIENFKSKDFFDMVCTFKTKNGEELKTTWDMPKNLLDEVEGKCLDKEKVKVIFDKVNGQTGLVTVSNKTRKQEDHPLLYSLDTLSKECNSKFGMSAADVLATAQSLYETHKATTYPRTDCEYINTEQLALVDKTFKSMASSDPSDSEINGFITRADQKIKSRAWNTKKVSAHHAIVPNIAKFDINRLTKVEKQVYELIRKRYIAQFFPKAEVDSSKIEILCEGEKFKASGTMPVSEGWKEVVGKKGESKELPVVDKGDELPNARPKVESKKTKPPLRYTEGTLLDAMKNAAKFVDDPVAKKMLKGTEGLGTVATRPEVIETIKKRSYIKIVKKNIISSDKGRALIEYAPEESKSIAMTAYWEAQLEGIAEGKVTPEFFLSEQEVIINKMIDEIRSGKCTLKVAVGALYTCPKCNAGLRNITSKKTKKKFWVCLNKEFCNTFYSDNRGKPAYPKEVKQGDIIYPCEVCKKSNLERKISQKNKIYWQCKDRECNQSYTDNDMVPVLNKPEVIDQGLITFKCFSCKKDDLVRRKGQYGLYWGCPSCRKNFKENSADQTPLEPPKPNNDYKCPNCKDGHLIKKNGKNGFFHACNSYPKCKTTKSDDNGKPEGFN